MKKTIFTICLLYAGIACQAQKDISPTDSWPHPFKSKILTGGETVKPEMSANTEGKLIRKDNSVFWTFNASQNVLRANLLQKAKEQFGLDFVFTGTESKDELGFLHFQLQQMKNGVVVEGAMLLGHERDGLITSVNGNIAAELPSTITPSITEAQAKQAALIYSGAEEEINTSYPIELVFGKSNKGKYTLVYKVRLDIGKPFGMHNYYVDAITGEVVNAVSLIAHADTPGSGNTYYSGVRNITSDSYTGGYRLRESGRNIQTFDATNATFGTNGFTGATDYTDSDNNWGPVSVLNSLTITSVAQSWWYTAFVDATPDLYIKIIDAFGSEVYSAPYVNNTNAPVTFSNINLLLTGASYTVEIWDYDSANAHDFGGSFSLSSVAGTNSFGNSNCSGNYSVSSIGNTALDVHWGMEKTYDFYLTKFARRSYDGNGSVIKQFLNPQHGLSLAPIPNAQMDRNNAFALPSPYNSMVYGMGDGQILNPVVGLDVAGHEYTHMVINLNGNNGLTYLGESGALNESFADIMGTAVEFYSKGTSANWTIGEQIALVSPGFIRSMSNPNTGLQPQPDTYGRTYWADPTNQSNDNGGVHTNSGVQNFWFYLLSQGGTGTNDLGNVYNVPAIGIDKATRIAYRNLVTYLTPSAMYSDAYLGSLQATADLYGQPSAEYTAVLNAWYAVGIGSNPNAYCSGTTYLTAASGIVTDGSGNADYLDNSNCNWVIRPPGATQITLTFTQFDTESNYDTVFVYDADRVTGTPVRTWWGNTLPPQVVSTGGALYIKFKSDGSNVASGWRAVYSSSGTPTCSGATFLTATSGVLSDGSGSGNYSNNQNCAWLIAPPCATSVSLNFTTFNTEANYDGVIVYDGDNVNAPQLGVFTGNTIPPSLTANSGKMLVRFISDYLVTLPGFSASYTSTGSALCGTNNRLTSEFGTFTDGSGTRNYCNSSNCNWLIQPTGATSVVLNFTAFDIESPNSDGTYYDAVEVFDGTNSLAPLIGKYAGNVLPSTIVSTGPSLFVRFTSDYDVNKAGFAASYVSNTQTYCTGQTLLTASSASFSDGSANDSYGNNSDCEWLIQPPNAQAITLNFTSFSVENANDGVIVRDGSTASSPIVGTYSGTSIPQPITVNGGSMLVQFLSNSTNRASGWNANYSSIINGLDEAEALAQSVQIVPNPASDLFEVLLPFESKEDITVAVTDILGRVIETHSSLYGRLLFDAKEYSSGLYFVKITIGNVSCTKKLNIQK